MTKVPHKPFPLAQRSVTHSWRAVSSLSITCQAQSSAYCMAPSVGAKFYEWWLPPVASISALKYSCRSLTRVGTAQCPSNRLAPQAQLRPRAFQARTALSHIKLCMPEPDAAHPDRCLSDFCVLEAGSVALALPTDFNRIDSAACASCQQLQTVELSPADVLEISGSAVAHCSQVQQLCLSRNLRIIEQEAFLKCTSLQEVSTPPPLLYIARRAFAGCAQLRAICKQRKSKTW